MAKKQYIACRPFEMNGEQVQAGQVVDVGKLGPGKRDILVRSRYLAIEEVEEVAAEPVKRKRGRPRKHPVAATG